MSQGRGLRLDARNRELSRAGRTSPGLSRQSAVGLEQRATPSTHHVESMHRRLRLWRLRRLGRRYRRRTSHLDFPGHRWCHRKRRLFGRGRRNELTLAQGTLDGMTDITGVRRDGTLAVRAGQLVDHHDILHMGRRSGHASQRSSSSPNLCLFYGQPADASNATEAGSPDRHGARPAPWREVCRFPMTFNCPAPRL